MNKDSPKKAWQFVSLAIIFFATGVLSTLIYQKQFRNTQTILKSKYAKISSTPTIYTKTYEETTPAKSAKAQNTSSSKFTIVEKERIKSDKLTAETGEQVDFAVTLKNEGVKKKFLTHICFNHSGGITFGCVRNMNLAPQEEFRINNSMMFKKPGRYSVWVTWSQDHTNFYRPANPGTASVTIQ